MAQLFDAEFIAAISRLRIAASKVPRGGRHAEQTSVQLGAGLEFRDFRSYAVGDDFRHIDWNLYMRTGALFLRLFEEQRDLPVYILLDCSDSMFFEDPPRADAARRAAAALAAAALNQHDRPGIYPFGADLLPPLRNVASKQSFPRALRYLENLGQSGPTNMAACLQRFGHSRHRRGMVVVISDFFDPQGIESVTNALRSLHHKLLLVQVAKRTDAEPNVAGELELVDCESGVGIETTVSPQVLESYKQAYAAFENGLLEFAAKRGAGFMRLDADESILDQISALFRGGVYTVRG